MGAYYFRASGSNDKGGDHHAGHPPFGNTI